MVKDRWGAGYPHGQGGVAGDSPSRRVDGGAEKNDDAVEFGRRRGAPMSSGGQQVDLRQGNEKGRVRSGPIVDVVHERVELTR
jgi:hypothetical protein